MKSYAPKRKKKGGGSFTKLPHQTARSGGDQWMPKTYDHRGSAEGWAQKLPAPGKKGKEENATALSAARRPRGDAAAHQ